MTPSTTLGRLRCLPTHVLPALLLLAALAGCGGGGDGASASPVVTTAVPAAPTALAATSGDGRVSLSFTAPASSGGSPISGYDARCTLGAAAVTASAPASPVVVTGLSNGSTYTCSVTASNSAGSSPASASVQALASAVPAVLNLDVRVLANYAAPVLPVHYDADVLAQDNTPGADPVTDRIATLGRVLFHERALSVNDTVACASCHQQANGFGDTARFSRGFAGALTTAGAMRLGNLRYYRPGTAFWDKRAASVEEQSVQPIQNGAEMGFDAAHGGMTAAANKLQSLAYIPELFQMAFGDTVISETRIRRALAQFERAMISAASRWDTGFATNYNAALPDKGLSLPIAGFSGQEERGRVLFMGAPAQGGVGCARCHVPPTFALVPGSLSNGLDAGETTVFKSPSLKSVARSGGFMHDGRFGTLAQVVEHYNSGVQPGPALDNRLLLPTGQPRRLNLSEADKAALVVFLGTLDDSSLTSDPRFSDPFKR